VRDAKPGAGAKSPAAAKRRLRNLLEIERGFWSRGFHIIAGVDEAGRGPLAGPVVAAAVVMPPEYRVRGANDSKALDAGKREALAIRIVAKAQCFGVGAASCREIDRLNIRRATALAMNRAIARLSIRPEHLLVDGLTVPELGTDWQTAVVDGDARVHSIACASILAKVWRDRLMCRLALRYPLYGWERNKGYGTPEHLGALREHGLTPHHRRSFQPVEQLTLLPEILAV
jgi:ribonuclease HII